MKAHSPCADSEGRQHREVAMPSEPKAVQARYRAPSAGAEMRMDALADFRICHVVGGDAPLAKPLPPQELLSLSRLSGSLGQY